MGITDFVSRLSKVRQSGVGRFIACCPAHEDKNPSLSVSEGRDGRILVKCWAGCEVEAILDAVGVGFSDLFPESLSELRRERHSLPRLSRPFSADEALECLRTESAVVAFCAADLAQGKSLSEADASRLMVATGRIATALEVVHGR